MHVTRVGSRSALSTWKLDRELNRVATLILHYLWTRSSPSIICPEICRWDTMVRAYGSVEKAYKHFYLQGIRGFVEAWPLPSVRAWMMVGSFVVFEALLHVLLPGERFARPSTPTGNRPLYTVNFFLTSPSQIH